MPRASAAGSCNLPRPGCGAGRRGDGPWPWWRSEGKFHQVKRMFEATGNRVLELRRLAVGGLVLDPALGPGECRLLSEEEAASVFS